MAGTPRPQIWTLGASRAAATRSGSVGRRIEARPHHRVCADYVVNASGSCVWRRNGVYEGHRVDERQASSLSATDASPRVIGLLGSMSAEGASLAGVGLA